MAGVGQSSSNVTILGLGFLLCMVFLTLRMRRQNALIPLLITTCYMPLGQQFVVAGLDIQFFRILLLAGWARVWFRNEMSDLRLTTMDKLFLWWAAATVVMGTCADLTMARFINRAGVAFNALGSYFLVRCWVRDMEDVIHGVRFLAVMIVPLALSMIVEKITGRNIFYVFGGVPEFTGVREGRLRCQGAFRHPILAGTYGATLLPLFIGLWFARPAEKLRAAAGTLSAMVVAVAAASSGALLAMMAAMGGMLLWRVRDHMRLVRWGIVMLIGVLAVMMNAPVWFIIARISEIAGGTGWYRSYLIDQAIKHFDEWWLVGSTYTVHWAPAGEVVVGDPNNMDIINNYVAEGLGGGMLKLGLFVAMIVVGFRVVGKWVRSTDCAVLPGWRLFVWSTGVCLLAHCASFISVAYFDQIVVMWYWLLGVFSALSLCRHLIPASILETTDFKVDRQEFDSKADSFAP